MQTLIKRIPLECGNPTVCPREGYVMSASASHFVTCQSWPSTDTVTCLKRVVMRIKRSNICWDIRIVAGTLQVPVG